MSRKPMTKEEKVAFAAKMKVAREAKKPIPTIELEPIPKGDGIPPVETGDTTPATDQEPAQEPAPETLPETLPTPQSNTVVFRSADNRKLEVSIGNEIWKGKEISVPVEQAVSVRRLLVEGGFFLKD